jgi:hypothetical protein
MASSTIEVVRPNVVHLACCRRAPGRGPYAAAGTAWRHGLSLGPNLLISVKNFGAGEGIRTLDPNLGKDRVATDKAGNYRLTGRLHASCTPQPLNRLTQMVRRQVTIAVHHSQRLVPQKLGYSAQRHPCHDQP